MVVYLLRHGVAQEGRLGLRDEDRALTSDGRRKLRDVLNTALRAEAKPSLILSSPLRRAMQTAEVAKQVLNYSEEIAQTMALAPGSSVEQVWDEIRTHRNQPEVLLVGHDPLFSSLPGHLLNTPSLRIEFKKGALMRIDFDRLSGAPHGVLRWYLVSKLAAHSANNNSRPAGSAR